MVVDTEALQLKLIRRADGLELDLLPLQGLWTEEQYLKLTDQTNHLIAFTDGVIEVLPMPTRSHQVLLLALYELLRSHIEARGGEVLVAPFRVRIRPRKFREPDIVALLDADDPRNQESYWLGADLVVEIVSSDRPERDTEQKPRDYAEARIPEYWIVNPLDETVTVLTLRGDTYAVSGVFRHGDHATSLLIEGFDVQVDNLFGAPRRARQRRVGGSDRPRE